MSAITRILFQIGAIPLPAPVGAAVIVSIALAISTWVSIDKANDFTTDNEYFRPSSSKFCKDGKRKKFDFIVVGAGTAGMVVATRIANGSKDSSVLLLEAGGEPSPFNNIPGLTFPLLREPANTWIYNTTPQDHACIHCDDRKIVTTRGKMLGGSSQINLMMYVRGNKRDYDRWSKEDAAGDPQWNYESLLPYFLKSEDYHGFHKNAEDVNRFHGKGGLLHVGSYDYHPGAEDLIAAAKEKGYLVGDYNGAKQDNVFSHIDVIIKDGRRESTYRAFYNDTEKPPNLCIRKYAHVVKIDFEEDWKILNRLPRATGVTYVRQGITSQVRAEKEIILSAGVFGSPKLLLLSGIGPKTELEALNISVIKDLPVGKNLQDHVFTFVGPFLISPSFNPSRDTNLQAGLQFLVNQSGPYASPLPLAGLGFFKSPVAKPGYADLQVVQNSISLFPELPKAIHGGVGISQEVMEKWLEPYHKENTDARIQMLAVCRPKSVGYLKLASTDPDDNPIINPNYLQNPDDVEALVYGFKKIVELHENTNALNHTSLFRKPLPGCEQHTFKSDEYYRCFIRHISISFYHHVGTCALGKVVDNNLRVRGLRGLRVIDASVIPRTPNGNTMAPTIVVAEKGADLILKQD